ncbi:MAG: phosphate acyltransferase PlsX [Clostridia bacterium]|nr:phosphate acyltransferase PlsX [Clostridia bacterium]
MKIVVDGFGGDNAPKAIVEGVLLALDKYSDLEIVLTGDEETLKSLVAGMDNGKITYIHSTEIITNEESPTEAIRTKKDSSLVKALDYLKTEEECVGFVSAGSTGAVLTGATVRVGRIRGITRPALCPMLPTVKGGQVLLVDCGANADCKAPMLVQFAIMGSSYAKAVLGLENPREALLSNGTEDKKGNELTHEAFALLKECKSINFVGNMEAREMISGDYDVIVSDGFSGNVALKSCEGTAVGVFKIMKKAILGGGLRAKLGYLLLKPALKKVKDVMDYSENGGAGLLGITKPVIKSHGASEAKSICASIGQVIDMHKGGIIEKIKQGLPQEQ